MSENRAVTVKIIGDKEPLKEAVKRVSTVLNVVYVGDVRKNSGAGFHTFLTALLDEEGF